MLISVSIDSFFSMVIKECEQKIKASVTYIKPKKFKYNNNKIKKWVELLQGVSFSLLTLFLNCWTKENENG